MVLVPAICTQCGANIEVDRQKEAAICPFCGTAYIVEHAINNYYSHTDNNYLGPITVSGINKFDDLYRKLVAFKQIGEKEKCIAIVEEMIEEFPDKCESWYYKAEIVSENFTKKLSDSTGFVHVGLIDDCIYALQKIECNNQEYLDRCITYQTGLINENEEIINRIRAFMTEESNDGIYFNYGSTRYGIETREGQLYYVIISGGLKKFKRISPQINTTYGKIVYFQDENGEKIRYWTDYPLEWNFVSISIDEVEAFYSGNSVKWYKDKELYNRKEDERSIFRKIYDFIDSF